jgi:hypothetical protein
VPAQPAAFQRLQVTSRAAAVVRAFPNGYAETGADEAFPAGGRAGPAVAGAQFSA